MSHDRVEIQVAEGGARLDRFLVGQVVDYSRSALQRLIEEGHALVNGAAAKASYRLRTGDRIVLALPQAEPSQLASEPISLDIVFEDACMLVVNKPPGMVVHPAPGHHTGTLVNALMAYCPELAGVAGDRPGIVHRLDRDTSGLIMVAKSDPVRRALQRQFQEHRVHKTYLALLDGRLDPSWGRICAPLDRDPHHRQRIAVQVGGHDATTQYRVVETLARRAGSAQEEYTLARVEPETGRTHQIRVHFASIGHPVAGDSVYGRRRCPLPLDRQFLHAWRLAFEHPTTGRPVALEAPLPQDLSSVLELLRQPS